MRLREAGVLAAALALALACDDGGSDGDDGAGSGTGGAAGSTGGGTAGTPGGGAGGTPGGGGTGGTPGGGADYGPYGPAGRVNVFEIPMDLNAAVECPVAGTTRGTALNGLVQTVGADIGELVNPDPATGEISVILLGQLAGWIGTASSFTLNVYIGDQAGADFSIDPDSYVNSDPNNVPQGSIVGGTIDAEGNFQVGPASFTYSIPFEGAQIRVAFRDAVFEGKAALEGPGVRVTDAAFGAYMDDAGIQQLVSDFRAYCATQPTPEACTPLVTNVINADNAVDTLKGLVGGYDTLIGADGTAADCSGDTCNALSVCSYLAMEPVTITGITPAQ
jgi:hypothetical protein